MKGAYSGENIAKAIIPIIKKMINIVRMHL
jgi:hypothetical protein